MHFVEGTWDTADKSQSSRHIACAVHLESLQILKSGRHDGACLLLLSALSLGSLTLWIFCNSTKMQPIPPIALVAFGESVRSIAQDRGRVLELLQSDLPRERAGAIGLLVTQFGDSKSELVSILARLLGTEESVEPRAHAERYLQELQKVDRIKPFRKEIASLADDEILNRFEASDAALKIAIAVFTFDSECNWKSSAKRQVALLAFSDNELSVKLAGMSALANPFYRTSDFQVGKRFAEIACNQIEIEKVRVHAAMMVYHIFRPRILKLFEPGYQEFLRLENESDERLRRLLVERLNGMDMSLLNFVLTTDT